jgi:hypothetical protein
MEIGLIIIAVFVTYILTKRSQEKYWRRILKLHDSQLVAWDFEPKCPYCERVNEAAFTLGEEDKWYPITCVNCQKEFEVMPMFETTVGVRP